MGLASGASEKSLRRRERERTKSASGASASAARSAMRQERAEEREMLPLCRAEGIGVIPWSPMARGRLTRNWNETSDRQETDEFGKTLYTRTLEADRQVIERVAAVAKARGVPRAQVALAWALQKSEVTAPIIGASKLQHLDDAVAKPVAETDARGNRDPGAAVHAPSRRGVKERVFLPGRALA